jgi:hypothetical protein
LYAISDTFLQKISLFMCFFQMLFNVLALQSHHDVSVQIGLDIVRATLLGKQFLLFFLGLILLFLDRLGLWHF